MATILCLLWSTAGAADPPRLKFRAGETQRYFFTIESKTNAVAMGNEVKQSMNYSMLFTWKVGAVGEDGLAEVEQVTERMRLVLENPGVTVRYDSADAESQLPAELAPVLKPVIATLGAVYKLKVDGRGEIVSMVFPDKYREATGLDAESLQMVFEREKPIKRLGELGYTLLPAEPLEVDQTVEDNGELEPLAKGGLKFHFVDKRDPNEEVDGVALEKYSYALNFEEESLKAMKAKEYQTEGAMLFDPEQGEFERLTFRQLHEPDLPNFEGETITTKTTRLLTADEDPFAESAQDDAAPAPNEPGDAPK